MQRRERIDNVRKHAREVRDRARERIMQANDPLEENGDALTMSVLPGVTSQPGEPSPLRSDEASFGPFGVIQYKAPYYTAPPLPLTHMHRAKIQRDKVIFYACLIVVVVIWPGLGGYQYILLIVLALLLVISTLRE